VQSSMGMTAVSKVGRVHSIDEMHQVARMMTGYLIKIHLLKATVGHNKFLPISNSWRSRCINTHTEWPEELNQHTQL